MEVINKHKALISTMRASINASLNREGSNGHIFPDYETAHKIERLLKKELMKNV